MPTGAAAERLALYRRAANAMEAFFQRFTTHFCGDCLEVTRRHHRSDPRADVDLVQGVFPGCCQAGVGDAFWVPRSGDEGRFSPELTRAMGEARAVLGPYEVEPPRYVVRERTTGIMAEGVGCRYLEPGGCRLRDLKSPLCVSYVCEPVREALAAKAGWRLLGPDTDDFCGVLDVLRKATSGNLEEAGQAMSALESRLRELARLLEDA